MRAGATNQIVTPARMCVTYLLSQLLSKSTRTWSCMAAGQGARCRLAGDRDTDALWLVVFKNFNFHVIQWSQLLWETGCVAVTCAVRSCWLLHHHHHHPGQPSRRCHGDVSRHHAVAESGGETWVWWLLLDSEACDVTTVHIDDQLETVIHWRQVGFCSPADLTRGPKMYILNTLNESNNDWQM